LLPSPSINYLDQLCYINSFQLLSSLSKASFCLQFCLQWTIQAFKSGQSFKGFSDIFEWVIKTRLSYSLNSCSLSQLTNSGCRVGLLENIGKPCSVPSKILKTELGLAEALTIDSSAPATPGVMGSCLVAAANTASSELLAAFWVAFELGGLERSMSALMWFPLRTARSAEIIPPQLAPPTPTRVASTSDCIIK